MASRGFVSIVVLNFNRARDTVECVESLQKMLYRTYRILVVDNYSTDDSFDLLQKLLSNVELVRTRANLGYTGGINFGIKHVLDDGPEYVLLLNNDAVVEPDFLDILVAAMEEEKKAAAACGTIYCHHDKTRVWYAGGRFIPWRGLAVHDERNAVIAPEKLNGIRHVSFITGCLMLLRVSYLKDIGGEDERFFMYLDDIELSARIRSRGYDLLYVPKAIIFHKVEGEKESAFKLYYSVRNRLMLIKTSVTGYTKIVAYLYFLMVISTKLFFWFFFNEKFFHAAFDGLHDYFSNNLYMGRGIAKFLD